MINHDFLMGYGAGKAAGGGGGFTLICTKSIGHVIATGTSEDTGVTLTFDGAQEYDLFLIAISNDTPEGQNHICTVSLLYSTGTSSSGARGTLTLANTYIWNSWNDNKRSRVGSSNGLYAPSATKEDGKIVCPIYSKSSANYTGTIDGTYTARVYGLKLVDL